MKKATLITILGLVLLASSSAFAKTEKFKGYNFNAYVTQANHHAYKEFQEAGKTVLKVRPQEEYAIVVRNPLPVQVAVAVTIDGLNTIDGKRTTPSGAQKWIIEPHGSVTISGWQTGKQTMRKFVFTEDTASYAQWREKREGKPYGRNTGVIGIAWFWNKEELHAALHPPEPFLNAMDDRLSAASAGEMRKRGSAAPSRAGTGMGREEQHHVYEVEFHANEGMYQVRNVMKIFYEFAAEPEIPQPFVDEERDGMRFAPEMP